MPSPKLSADTIPSGEGIASQTSQPPSLLLVFSHLRWNFVFQRPQHLLRRAARTNRVVFWEEPILRGESEPQLETALSEEGVLVATPVLPEGLSEAQANATQKRLLDRFLAQAGSARLITWYYTPMALRFSMHLEPALCVYDCMDELASFKGAAPILRGLEAALLSRSDLVFTGGRSLFEAKRGRHGNIFAFPSSIDADHFRRARDRAPVEPDDQAAIPHPRIGFFAVIDERLDIELLGQVAAARPDWQFVMLGPIVKIDPASLPDAPNIHWLGSKTYKDLPSYLAGWDAGLMPFAINEATRFISPTKTPEFLAAGIPTVSTPITDVAYPYGKAGLVEIANDAAAAVAKLDMLLARPRKAWLEAADKHLAIMSWDLTWEAMEEEMERTLQEKELARAARPHIQASSALQGARDV